MWLGYLELFGFLAIVNMQEGKTVPWRHCQNGSKWFWSSEDRKPGDFGLRGFYPADAKGQYEMQVGGSKLESQAQRSWQQVSVKARVTDSLTQQKAQNFHLDTR